MLKRFLDFCITDAWWLLLVCVNALTLLLVVASGPPMGRDARADYQMECEDHSYCEGDCVCCAGECVCEE